MASSEIPSKVINAEEIKNADSVQVLINAYYLDTSQSVPVVFKHELKFFGTYPKAGQASEPRDLSRGPRNDVATHTRRNLLWEMFGQMLRLYPDIFGGPEVKHRFIYDCGINMYSTVKVLEKGDTSKFDLELDSLPEECRIYLGSKVTMLQAHLLACEEVHVQSVDAITENSDRSAVQFLEILSSQEMVARNTHYMFANKAFEQNSEIRLQGDPRVLKEGLQKNVRFVGDSIESAVPMLQLDPKKSAFFPATPLLQFVGTFGRNLDGALKQIKGLTVQTTHMPDNRNRRFVINGFSDNPVSSQMIDMEGQVMSVATYYQSKYQLRITQPQMPCVVERRPGAPGKPPRDSFFPLEVCVIVAGQRVQFNQQTPQLVEQMIRNCQALPKDFRRNNMVQVKNAHLQNNAYLQSLNIRMAGDLIVAKANVLFPPAITYDQSQRDEPDAHGQLNWKLGQRRFLRAASTPKVWAAVIFQMGVDGASVDNFIGRLLETCQRRGMQVQQPTRSEVFERTDVEYVRAKMEFYHKANCGFVMFFTKDKLDDVHHTMKLMETEWDMTTQHISSQTVQKALGPKGAQMVIDNVSLKFNLKLGGINYGMSTAHQMCIRNPACQHDVVAKEWMADARLFIGLDMSHAGPQSLYERQAKIPATEPTIVGMAYTCGHPLLMRGTYWCQKTRETSILELTSRVKQAVINYAEKTKRWPLHVMVYRGGTSEGAFATVADQEQGAFVTAFAELQAEHVDFRIPELTIVVVQHNSNYRIVPTNVNPQGRPHEQNVRPGTVVDQGVMHPSYTEFLMVGHKTIQGTAQPVRCTVVVDTSQPRMPLEELEYVSYDLCYAHGIVLSPVSVPAPLYSASDLAKRGRNNWKVSRFGIEDRSYDKNTLRDQELPPDFFSECNDVLRPDVPTKFWA